MWMDVYSACLAASTVQDLSCFLFLYWGLSPPTTAERTSVWPCRKAGRRAFAHIHIQSGALCKDVGLYFHFIQLFPDNNTNICRTVPQQGGPVWWIPSSLGNYSAPYKSVRLPVGSLNVSTKGSYYILTTAGFSYLAQHFSRDSRNLTQKTCEIV